MEKKNPSNRPWKAEFGGIAKLICMSNLRNFAEIAPNIGFSEFDFYDLYRSTFEKSELGRMKKQIVVYFYFLSPLPKILEVSKYKKRMTSKSIKTF